MILSGNVKSIAEHSEEYQNIWHKFQRRDIYAGREREQKSCILGHGRGAKFIKIRVTTKWKQYEKTHAKHGHSPLLHEGKK